MYECYSKSNFFIATRFHFLINLNIFFEKALDSCQGFSLERPCDFQGVQEQNPPLLEGQHLGFNPFFAACP